ncbi:NrfD/PsrC family molybdoenzyme membrane anchor subunit [Bradymonas sediminis]|uniref:Hydrogenase n=1 Tax=Bradymonas sediminis TaxID=1548548 RepID=A0A2Z4FN75_9DELT|nr:NrfD/PsrC family molybdoenzyme membrane anchor subunit [Bradymonas sediminis]AWV90138.1 hydrogenase [Bradymonas sediminis]TDP75895.1 quinol:cytochrome c oxidoreductase quinone-binding subunit 1 [Bradymonas sediminis]
MKNSDLTGFPNYHEGAGPFGGAKATREPLVVGNKSYADVTNDIAGHLERFPTKLWWLIFIPSFLLLLVFLAGLAATTSVGMGVVGLNSPVGWGVFIVTFVFWIGIGHAGTLISAILFLFNQGWRTAINRSAEAMTIFAVMTAGIFPLMHTGRPWFAYWLFPLPNGRGPLWVNFNSPLLWDVFAVSTYATISVVFWYTGLVPDLATIRDRAKHPLRKKIYGALSIGWTGGNRAWRHYEMAYLMLAGIATPLVLSVHTIVSFDFAVSVIPGWHTTIFPPYFVAGAIFSGFGMVLTLSIVLRAVFNLKDYITINHIELCAKILLLTSMVVGIAYATEFFIAYYSGTTGERFHFANRMFGPYWWASVLMYGNNCLLPQVLWFKKARRNIPLIFVLSICVNIGMWFERYVIFVVSLHRDYLPSSWGIYDFKPVDFMLLYGSFGMFLVLFLLFCRVLPTITIFEVKTVMNHDEAVEIGRNQKKEVARG